MPKILEMAQMRFRRGNILISAIFIAVFLFFLSVALISTNRQDISLTLLADSKLRARHAAEQGATFALQTMQSNPQWETLFKNKIYTNNSSPDFNWTVTVIPKTDFGAFLTPANPTNATQDNSSSWKANAEKNYPHFYEVLGQGVSGIYQISHKLLVEEFRMCDSIATTAKKPYLFVASGTSQSNVLSMLDPTFNWQNLGSLPPGSNISTFTGNGGDVFVGKNPTKSATPLPAWTFTRSGNFLTNYKLTATTSQQLPPQMTVKKLSLSSTPPGWIALPDPNTSLGTGVITQPTGVPNYQNVSGQTVDVGEYKGPSVEYYAIDGAFYADQTSVVCHATHYFLQQSLYQNHADGSPPTQPASPIGLVSAPCILRCTPSTANNAGSAKVWSVVTDLLKVTDKLSPPEVAPQPWPNKTYLCVDESNDQVYSLGNSASGQGFTVLKAEPRLFSDLAVPLSNSSFIYYQGKLRTSQLTPNPQQTGISSDYTGLDFPPLYPIRLPGRLGKDYLASTHVFVNVTIAAPQNLTWGQSIQPGGIVVVGQDIIGTGNVSAVNVTKLKPGQAPAAPAVSNFFCHYDGYRWQLWPSGFYPLISGLTIGNSTGPSPVNASLALGAYTSPVKLLRRYQVIMTEDL